LFRVANTEGLRVLTKRQLGLVLAGLTLAVPMRAQVPAVPGAPPLPGGPVPPAATTTAGAAAPAAAAPKNIWSFFMKTPEQKAQCKAHFCNSRIGQFMNNMLLPAGLATGGMLGPICPGSNAPNPADLAKPATSPQGAAAKIKAEEAQAAAKIAAIEYLATVDCRYYPEAEAALINGLRAEKNECVRLAAAKALASGCCCSAKVVKALTISVNCSTKDDFPAEASELVRTFAYVALERCLRKCIEAEPEVPPEPPPAAKKAMYETLVPMGTIPDYTATILLASYYAPERSEPPAAIFASARQTLSRGLQLSKQTVARLSGPRNVRDAMFPDGVKPVSFSMPQLAFARKSDVPEQPRQYVMNVSGPVEPGQPVPVTHVAPQPERKPGRGNLLNIAQDAWRK
jgi:hypothetical protein